MLADHLTILADDDAITISMDVDRPADRPGHHRVAVVVEADQAGLRYRGRHRMEAIEAAGIGDEPGALILEHVPDGALLELGMLVGPGIGNAAVEQPGVQLLKALHPQPGRKEALAHHANLVLDPRLRGGRLCPFSQPAAGVQATGSTR